MIVKFCWSRPDIPFSEMNTPPLNVTLLFCTSNCDVAYTVPVRFTSIVSGRGRTPASGAPAVTHKGVVTERRAAMATG